MALVLASTAAFALAGVLTKTISADSWTIVCWRGLIGGLMIAAYVQARRGARPLGQTFGLGPKVWLLAAVGAGAGAAFIAAFKHTFVGNVAAIYATAPFMAALLDRMIFRQPVSSRTMVAAGLSLVGVLVIVQGGIGGGSLLGDALALLMTALCALYLVLVRAFRDTPVVWAGALSGFQLFLLGWLVTDPISVDARDAALIVLFGGTYALAIILWTEGARLIPAAEAGLLGAAEIPLAIVLASLVLAEWAPLTSLAGAAIVVIAVAWHSLVQRQAVTASH